MSQDDSFRARSIADVAASIPDRGWRFWLGVWAAAVVLIGMVAKASWFAMVFAMSPTAQDYSPLYHALQSMATPTLQLGVVLAFAFLLSGLRLDGSTRVLWATVILILVAVLAASVALKLGEPWLAWAVCGSLLSLLSALAVKSWVFRVVWLVALGWLSFVSIGLAVAPADGFASLYKAVLCFGVVATQFMLGLTGMLIAVASARRPVSG